jgi:hypothetical protein
MLARFRARAVPVVPSVLLFLAASLASSACGSGGAGTGSGSGSSGSGSGSSSGSASGSGSGGVSPPFADGGVAFAPPCPLASLPSTLHLTVSGFTTCTCFNGTVTLTEQPASGDNPPVWSSPAITGCPGQQDTAYLKFSSTFTGYYDPATGEYVAASELGIGITDQGSDPDDGNSDYSPATSITCSPFAASGGGSTAGNIDSFCPGVEDEGMKWTIGP